MNSEMITNQPGESPTRQYNGVTFRPEKVRIRDRFANLDDPSVERAYNAACEDRAEVLAWGDKDPVYSKVPPFYMATIWINGKRRYLGSTQKAETAARLYDSALFHLWGFIKRKRNESRFNFYKRGDSVPEWFPRLRDIRRGLIRELQAQGKLAVDDYNFNNEQNA